MNVHRLTEVEQPKEISTILTAEALEWLCNEFVKVEAGVYMALRSVPLYRPAQAMINTMDEMFYRGPSWVPLPGYHYLGKQDLERCIIAVLAANGDPVPLAIHIFLGVMAGVHPTEVAHILCLAGAYGGISRFRVGLKIEQNVLDLLKRQADRKVFSVGEILSELTDVPLPASPEPTPS